MPTRTRTRKLLRCLRCGYEWFPRVDKKTGKPRKPTLCADCRSPYWDKPVRYPNRGRKRRR